MREKLIGTICLALGIIIFVTTGTSFAYFSVSAGDENTDITGTTINFDVDMKLETIHHSNQLIPLEDSLIGTAIKNNCVDNNGYQVCSLYKITLTNSGDAQVLNGYITSTDETTYTTDHLKCQLFNSNLTSSVSGVTSLIKTEDRQYFKLNDTSLYATEVTNNNVIYLAIWLTETHTFQNEDYSKKFYGNITFESILGGEISAKFNA